MKEIERRLFATRADAPRPTLLSVVGKRKKRWTINKEDRAKVFPSDSDAVTYAAHPDGEVAGYIQLFCSMNSLKP